MIKDRLRLQIITPSFYLPNGKLLKNKKRWMPGITMPYLAALTPGNRNGEVDILLTDDRIDEIDFTSHWDIVCLTVMTHQATRAVEIVKEFKKRGVTVVIGGWHPTFFDDELTRLCDTIMYGEAEDTWPQMIEDFKNGRLKKIYKPEKLPDLQNVPLPRWDLVNFKKFRIQVMPIFTVRGCPHQCMFCEVAAVHGTKFRIRPMEQVVEEFKYVKSLGKDFFFIIDDNFASKKSYTKELLLNIDNMKLKWGCMWTLKASQDEELLKIAQNAGLMNILMGMESINPETIKLMSKGHNSVEEYSGILQNLNKKGIFYTLSFIFGWDTDTEESFQNTLRFINKNKVPMAFFRVLTPRKGTKLYDMFNEEDRILYKDGDPREYSINKCIYTPKNFTPDELDARIWKMYRQMYSWKSMFKRGLLFPKLKKGYGLALGSNLFFYGGVRCNNQLNPQDYY
jgi:radical SAM superfamily enzyme YgiQ (UPF0313 family)